MDKNTIKKYAIWAREELIRRVSTKAEEYGITKAERPDAQAGSVHGRLLTETERRQRAALIARVEDRGYEQVIEEAAYTWFNRFIALRFMEVNNCLPSRVRVFTDGKNQFHPQILTEAIHLELDGLNMDRVIELKQKNDNDTLYKYLLITQCNALNRGLPLMFQKIDDYTELLFPDNILREGSVLDRLVRDIHPEDWTDQVQIIGWLYQYYNTVPKDTVFANLKKNIKISKENIPAATQRFTPDWIVRYMAENSLGRLWVEGHPDEELKSNWKYYLEEAEQELEVQAQLAEIHGEYARRRLEDIKVIDPCSGSGHICVYLFDVLMQIYERAAQLTYFAVMMKGCQYDSRLLTRTGAVPQPHVYAVCESNGISGQAVEYFVNGDPALKAAAGSILTEMQDAKEYGSLLNITPVDFEALYHRFDEIFDDREQVLEKLLPLVRLAEALAQKYDVVVTNPPYRGITDCSPKLIKYVSQRYPDFKSDLYSAFMKRCCDFVSKYGLCSMITMQSWMYLSSYKKLRKSLVQGSNFMCMLVLGSNAFDASDVGTVVQTACFVLRSGRINRHRAKFIDLCAPATPEGKRALFFGTPNQYCVSPDSFLATDSCQFMYDASPTMLSHFAGAAPLSKYAVAKPGMQTSDNDRFLRFWEEVDFSKIGFFLSHEEAKNSQFKWFPYNKGVGFRKWYGNNDYIVNFEKDGAELKYWLTHNPSDPSTTSWSRNLRNYPFYFQEGITFTAIGLSFSARLNGAGYLFDTKGPTMFGSNLVYLCGLVNSRVFDTYNKALCKQMTKSADSVNMAPVLFGREDEVERFVKDSVQISKADWDSFETSWDFTRHPLARPASTIAEAYAVWESECAARFSRLKSNEEELNRIFTSIYGLQDELTPEIEDAAITVRTAKLDRDIRSLLSYAVGCMFGRYSLDTDGLAYAGGRWDGGKYRTFLPDRDNIIPICDDEYFDGDMTGQFVRWVEIVYGASTLEENLRFIADALGGKGAPREVIRDYFRNAFYAGHCKIYQRRPIYWLFDSGRKGGFKALVYMHRYQPDTLARMRTDYVHEQQARYRTAVDDLERRIMGASAAERVRLNRQLTRLRDQEAELRDYEETLHHLADQMIAIDLDDGVKVNYAKFQDVLAKIK